jgi:hypothetical protein
LRQEQQPTTVEDERNFEEQVQLLENIVADVYAAPRSDAQN